MPTNDLHRRSFSNWQTATPYGVETPGQPTVMYGPEPFFRDGLDSRRSMFNTTPEAAYPDGYLGTITSRRDDRLLGALQQRQAERPQQRGVHKGEKINPRDYFWNADMDPNQGLARQSRSQFDQLTGTWISPRSTPAGDLVSPLVNDGKVAGAAREVMSVDPAVSARLQSLRPSWR